MLVPDMLTEAVSDEAAAASMLLPGAKTSTQAPKLEKEDMASEAVVEPTMTTSGMKPKR